MGASPFIRCLSNPVSICQPLPCLCLTDTVTQKHQNTKIQNTKCKKRKIGALISLFYRQGHHLCCYPCMYVLQLFYLWSLLQMSAICSSSTFAAVWPVEQQQRNRETESKQQQQDCTFFIILDISVITIDVSSSQSFQMWWGPGGCLVDVWVKICSTTSVVTTRFLIADVDSLNFWTLQWVALNWNWCCYWKL